jgi:hypothetical protein
MAKSKPPRHKSNKKRTGQWRKKAGIPQSRIPKLIKIPLEILAIVAAVASALTFIPKISIHSAGYVRKNDPMGAVFAISNDGILPIHDIRTVCYVDNAFDLSNNGLSEIGFVMPEFHAARLSPSKQMTMSCSRAVNMNRVAKMAQIVIFVEYRPDFVPWKRTESFPMEAQKADDGTWIWKMAAE